MNYHEMSEDTTFHKVIPSKLVMPFYLDLIVRREVIVDDLSQGLVSRSAKIAFEQGSYDRISLVARHPVHNLINRFVEDLIASLVMAASDNGK